jgi:hypothetical protein
MRMFNKQNDCSQIYIFELKKNENRDYTIDLLSHNLSTS